MKLRVLVSLLVLFSAFGSQGSVFANLQQPVPSESGSPATVDQIGINNSAEGEQMTPYQAALTRTIEERKAKNLPVPESVKFTYEDSTNSPAKFAIMASSPEPRSKKITATTVIQYANPAQAGLESWPAIVIENNGLPEGMQGTIVEGDYTNQIHEELTDQFPLFDQLYTFGQEPRQKVTTEIISITYPEPQILPALNLVSNITSTGSILMGKAYPGPQINFDKRVGWEWCFFGNCIDLIQARVYFELDWYRGLRLPGSVSISGPESVPLGSTGNFNASFHPEDWNAQQYEAAGVSAEEGHEYISRFTLRSDVFVKIGPGDPCWQDSPDNCPDPGDFLLSDTKDFSTPLGPGSSFYPEPQGWDPNIIDMGLFTVDVGVRLEPTLTSQKITADYTAVPGTDAVGSGTLTFANADTPVSLNPITACNTNATGIGKIRLSNFRYYFTDYKIKVSAWFMLDFDDLSEWGDGWEQDIDLSWVFDNPVYGISHGAFEECSSLFQCTQVSELYRQVELTFNTFDQDKPATTIGLVGIEGNNEWHTSDVEVTLTATDAPLDCGGGVIKTEYSLDGGVTWLEYSLPFKVTDEGKHTIAYRSTDKSGNIEDIHTQNVWIDKTPPEISGEPTTLPNLAGWYNTSVTVHFEATDAGSGLDTKTPDQELSTEGENQSATGTAVDLAGNESSFEVGNINIDKTQPVITITSPTATIYANTGTPLASWSVTDALSGVQIQSGVFNGDPVSSGMVLKLLLLPPGAYTLTVNAADMADNSASQSVTINTTVDINGLIAVLSYMCDQGLITSQGACTGMLTELTVAKTSIDKGAPKAAVKLLTAVLHQVDAFMDKSINPAEYDLLKTDINFVIQHLQ